MLSMILIQSCVTPYTGNQNGHGVVVVANCSLEDPTVQCFAEEPDGWFSGEITIEYVCGNSNRQKVMKQKRTHC